MRVNLNLPEGISVVGDQTVNVVVGVSAIEGSLTINDVRSRWSIWIRNWSRDLAATGEDHPFRPAAGARPAEGRGLRVIIDLGGLSAGTYQLTPRVELALSDLRVESVLPGSIEVIISLAPTQTPIPKK